MGQNNKPKTIIEKYEKLHKACSEYQTIVLGNWGNKPRVYQEIKGHAKDGFIEKFCK